MKYKNLLSRIMAYTIIQNLKKLMLARVYFHHYHTTGRIICHTFNYMLSKLRKEINTLPTAISKIMSFLYHIIDNVVVLSMSPSVYSNVVIKVRFLCENINSFSFTKNYPLIICASDFSP